MMTVMLVGLGVALLLDERLRRRRDRRPPGGEGARRGGEGADAGKVDAALPELPVLAPRGEDDLSDDQLVARVRAMVDVPAGVEVTAVEGAVVLFGRVPRFAFAALLSRVARVPGVVDVEDRLTPVDDLGAGEHI